MAEILILANGRSWKIYGFDCKNTQGKNRIRTNILENVLNIARILVIICKWKFMEDVFDIGDVFDIINQS